MVGDRFIGPGCCRVALAAALGSVVAGLCYIFHTPPVVKRPRPAHGSVNHASLAVEYSSQGVRIFETGVSLCGPQATECPRCDVVSFPAASTALLEIRDGRSARLCFMW